MSEVDVVFFDVGGVLLTNGWDRSSRRAACEAFDLDWEDFQDRHDFVADAFERGELTLDRYLERTVFYRDREFTRAAFVDFMKTRSEPHQDALEVAARLSADGRHVMATLNNESRELNEYRIDTFGLRDHFSMFFSSCYLGTRKPEPDIYRMAVDVVQRPPGRCVFVDDRELNLECADLAGIRPVHATNAGEIVAGLRDHGIEI